MYRNWRSLIRPRGLEIERETLTPTYGKFEVKPLERGFGITLGNSLRRILLSSLQGAAVAAVKINGIQHEFSAIPGVREDVTDIILNLKELRLKLHTGDSETMKLKVNGDRILTGKDIDAPSTVTILNPDLHIATLAPDAKLDMELFVRMGKGYVPAERNKDENATIGIIPIDSIYSPVLKVNFNVTNARVGQMTDYDRLVLEVWTNGSVAPEEAVAFAAKILKEQLQVFINFEEVDEPVETEIMADRPALNENLYRRVDELELSVRSANCLQNANIRFIGELCQRTESEMLRTKNFGRKSLNEIKEILAEMGLSLGMKLDGFNIVDAEKYRPKDVE
jgi:DNA-directed RNA polymerase subunit alpha